MRVNKKLILTIFFIILSLSFNLNIKAFNIYDYPSGGVADKRIEVDPNYHAQSIKYDKNNKKYFCTQPELGWPSGCSYHSTFQANHSAALTYLIRRYNDKNISYSAVQRTSSKLLWHTFDKTDRADYDLSKYLTAKIDDDVDTFYTRAYRLYTNNTKINYYRNGTTTRINNLSFPDNGDLTISYSIASPFGITCSVNNGGEVVSIDTKNKKIRIKSNGKHKTAITTLTCKSYYDYRKIHLYSCTNQDLMRVADDTTQYRLYGPEKSISSLPYYTVKYNGNGGKTAAGKTEFTDKQVVKGTTITILGNTGANKFAKEGYKFNNWKVKRSDGYWYVAGQGWLTSNQIKGKYYGKKYYPNHNHTLQGAWIRKPPKGDITNNFYTFTFYAQWLKDNGVLKIKKVNTQGQPILGKSISFDIYNKAGCPTNGKIQSVTINTGGDGIDEIELPPGHYYLTETKGPSNKYITDNVNCLDVGEVKAGETTEIVIENKNKCDTDLDDNNTAEGRLKLYRENYQTFNNLLDFNKTTAIEACNNTEYNLDSSNSCLSASRKKKPNVIFDHTNLSAYNDTLYYNNKTHYCLTQYTLNGSLGNAVTSGQFLSTNSILSKGTFTKTCYIHKNEIGSELPPTEIESNEQLEDYIGNVSLDNQLLENNYESSDIVYKLVTGDFGQFYKYEYNANVEYYSSDVYATIGKAEVMYEDCSNCKYIGKGVISKFYYKEEEFSIPFTISEPTNNILKLNGTHYCSYRTVPEITIENKLQLEFRPIDTKEPFNRNANSNWCIINDGNKDCTSNNKIITDTIINKTNSYGMNNGVKQTPKYTITLSSSDITNIREYNKNSSGYDDYDTMQKDDSGIIRSTFLTSLKGGVFGSKLIVNENVEQLVEN